MDGFVPVDHDTREEIRSSLGANLCVEAGAGTGKTTVLVDRITEILRTGHAGIDEIAVITFTEKAAAELAGRVRDALESALGKAADPTERDRLETAVRGLGRARIETIHAFASGLLRERPVEAGLDPGFEIMEDLAAELDLDGAFRSWLSAQMEAQPDALRRALNRGLGLKHVRDAVEALHRYRDLLPLRPERVDPPDVRGFVTRLADAVDELTPLLDRCGNPDDRGAVRIRMLKDLLDGSGAAGDDPEALERWILQAPKFPGTAGSRGNWLDAAAHARQKELTDAALAELAALQERLRTEATVGLLPLVEGFVRAYEEERRAAGRADFEDLLIWARNLLRDRPAVRNYFRDRFRCILVDEFQDTDPLQVEILLYLCSEGPPDARIEDLRPAPGRLFVVGDPKQSIYRFRRADITTYERVKKEILGEGLRLIRQNFRSLAGVIHWVNRVFERVITEDDGIQPAYVGLEPLPLELELPRPPVVVLHDEGGSADEARRREAATLAAVIRRAVEDEAWQVRDEESGELRPAAYRDVAILIPARTGLDRYEEALEAAGVPYRHEGGRAFFGRQEVRELLACLRAVDDPTDRLSLVAALRSGAFGCSDEEIFLHTTAGGDLDYRSEPASAGTAVAEAFQTLRRLHDLRRERPLPEFVQAVLESTRLVEFALTLPQGDQAAANLLKVVDQARAFTAARGGGLRAFVRWLTGGTERQADEADAAVAEAGDNVVRILTVHAAKGLEFPMVALANLNGESNRYDAAIPDRRGGRVHLRLGTDATGYFKTPGYDGAAETEQAHRAAERRRLLYVAATRARDHLIIPAVLNRGKASGMLADLLPHLPSRDEHAPGTDVDGHHVYDTSLLAPPPDRATGASAAPADPDAVEAELARREEWTARRRRLLTEAGRGLRVATASSVEAWDLPPPADEDEAAWYHGAGRRAAAVGTALHAVMESVSLPDGDDLEALASAEAKAAGVPERAAEIAGMARWCLSSRTVTRAVRSGRCFREAPFTLPLADGGMAEGRMDLLFQEEDGLVVADYKTDRVDAGTVRERLEVYRNQAAVYAYAVSRVTGLPVKEVVFLFARPGIEQTLPVDEDLLALGERLAMTAGTFGTEEP